MGCKVLFLLVLGLSTLVFRVASQDSGEKASPPPPQSTVPTVIFGTSPYTSSIPFNVWSERNSSILTSPNKAFSFILEITNYSVSSCVAKLLHNPSKVSIWIANYASDAIEVGSQDIYNSTWKCQVRFSKNGLELRNQSGIVWSRKETLGDNSTLELSDDGNLMIKDTDIKWSSFDVPSNVLVAHQVVKIATTLTAADPNWNNSKGNFFSMQVQPSSVTLTQHFKISYPVEKIYSFPYYNVTTSNNAEIRTIGLSNQGFFLNNNTPIPSATLQQPSAWLYTRLDQTGALVISSYTTSGIETENKTINANVNCSLPGQCGPYGLCHLGNNSCGCPPGFEGSLSPYFTCKRKVDIDPTCKNDSFISVTGMTHLGPSIITETQSFTLAECRQNCFGNCACTNALHVKNSSQSDSGTCYLMLGEAVQTIRKTGNAATDLQTLFLRIVNGSDVDIVRPDGGKKSSRRAADAFAGVAGVFIFFLLAGSIWWLSYNRRKLLIDADHDTEKNLLVADLPFSKSLRRFSYQEMVESTDNFSKKLGSAGFSCVYRGHLPDNTKVAVKKLDDIDHKEKDFLAAVAAIGCIPHHPNLVPLRGYCKEGQHQMLVYELVTESQSLNRCLFNATKSVHMLAAQDRHLIAVGTARGVAHLHQEYSSCKIIHGGLKPENIIIDRQNNPRLVDYGLVGLIGREQRLRAANLRNSQGYLAPEWVKLLPITEKVDVYSLGIVILEIVSGRRCIKQGASAEQCFLPTWGFSLIRRMYGDGGLESVLDLVDPSLGVRDLSTAYQLMLRNMIYVALRCVQDDIIARPSMLEVLKMLEGPSPVEPPPACPGLEAFGRELCAGCAGERGPESSNSSSFMHSTSLSRSSDKRPR